MRRFSPPPPHPGRLLPAPLFRNYALITAAAGRAVGPSGPVRHAPASTPPACAHIRRVQSQRVKPRARMVCLLTACRRVGVTCSPCRRSARRRATAGGSARTWGGSGRRSSRPSPGALLTIAREIKRKQVAGWGWVRVRTAIPVAVEDGDARRVGQVLNSCVQDAPIEYLKYLALLVG